MKQHIQTYKVKLLKALEDEELNRNIENLYNEIIKAWKNRKNIYLCGNGGSAGNAAHIANDLLYGAGISNKCGLNAEALSANQSIITCLANDEGYENIFSEQLKVKAKENDILIVLSGSGNSQNVVNALMVGNSIKMRTFALLGFDGGKCLALANNSVHFKVHDMQVAEDLQLIVMHMIMQKLSTILINN